LLATEYHKGYGTASLALEESRSISMCISLKRLAELSFPQDILTPPDATPLYRISS
jgi:hypothetical protein